MLDDYSSAKDLEFEAHQYFVEAVSYGDLAISQIHNDYYKWLIGKDELKPDINLENQDFDLFYWVAAAYGGAISSSGGNPKWIIKLPKVGKLLNSIIDINPTWNNGAALVAKISYTMNNPLFQHLKQIQFQKVFLTLLLMPLMGKTWDLTLRMQNQSQRPDKIKKSSYFY